VNLLADATLTDRHESTSALDRIVTLVDQSRHELQGVLAVLPDSAALFACIDLVTALDHLRLAAVAIDKAADQLDTA
jgi:hypothetical protein